MILSLFTCLVALFFAALVSAEQHTVSFVNRCGYGTPALVLDGKNVSTGQSYTSNGPFSGIAYLQTGPCLANGENCALLETTLINPTVAGGGSSTDISLIAPHKYNVETSFAYYGGCNGQGTTCSSANCNTAFFNPNDNQVQVACQDDNVNLVITFCGNASDFVTSSGSLASSPSSGSGSGPEPTSASASASGTPASSGIASSSSVGASPTSSSATATPTSSSGSKSCSAKKQSKRDALEANAADDITSKRRGMKQHRRHRVLSGEH